MKENHKRNDIAYFCIMAIASAFSVLTLNGFFHCYKSQCKLSTKFFFFRTKNVMNPNQILNIQFETFHHRNISESESFTDSSILFYDQQCGSGRTLTYTRLQCREIHQSSDCSRHRFCWFVGWLCIKKLTFINFFFFNLNIFTYFYLCTHLTSDSFIHAFYLLAMWDSIYLHTCILCICSLAAKHLE